MQRSCYHVYVMQANKLSVNIIILFWDPCIDDDQSQLENWNYICQNLNKAMLSAILQSGHSCLRGQANLSFWQENLWYGNLLFISNCAMKSVTIASKLENDSSCVALLSPQKMVQNLLIEQIHMKYVWQGTRPFYQYGGHLELYCFK